MISLSYITEINHKNKGEMMDHNLTEVLVPSVMFISIAVVFVFFILARFNERKALIEKGLSGDDLKAFLENQKRKTNPYTIAKLAISAIGIGIALLLGSFISGEMQEQVTFGMVLLFPGVGLFFFYMYIAKKEKNRDED